MVRRREHRRRLAPAGARPVPRRADSPHTLPRSLRPHPVGDPAPLRQHARPALRRARDDPRRRELVGPARGRAARSTARSATLASLATSRSRTCTSCRSAPTGRTTRSSACRSRPASRTFGSPRRRAPGCSATADVRARARARRATGLRRARVRASTSKPARSSSSRRSCRSSRHATPAIERAGRGGVRLGDAHRRRLR